MTTESAEQDHSARKVPLCRKCNKEVEEFSVGRSFRRGHLYSIESRCHNETDAFEYYPVSPTDPPFVPVHAFPSERPTAVGAAASGPSTSPLDVQAELLAMPEWETLSRIRHFGTSIGLFRQNAAELVQYLDFLTKDARTFHLSDVRRRAAMELAMNEVLRRLHNFAASAQSLVDHSRVLFGDLYDADNFPDYEQKKKELFIDNPLIQFVHCLRQFAQHYRLPHISFVLNATRETGITRSLVLQKDDLMKFSAWNAGAKKYLAGAAQQIDMREVVVAYEETVRTFYEWVQTRQKQIHAADIAKVEEKQAEARALLAKELPQLFEQMIVLCEKGVGRVQDVFAPAFGSQDWVELAPLEATPLQWVNAAIDRVSKRFAPISDDLVRRLRAAATSASAKPGDEKKT